MPDMNQHMYVPVSSYRALLPGTCCSTKKLLHDLAVTALAGMSAPLVDPTTSFRRWVTARRKQQSIFSWLLVSIGK